MNNNSMAHADQKYENQECKITRAYGQKTLLKSQLYFERGARLTKVSFESEGESTMMHPEHHKKAAL